jgi:hypothetical protein
VKIKLDENLPDRLVVVLTALGHNVDTVRTEQLTGRADPDVWGAAQAAQRFLITQDLDFSDVRRYTPGTHAGLLLVRLTRPGRKALFSIEEYPVVSGLSCPPLQTAALAECPRRLADVPELTQTRLINWGYAICDAARTCRSNPRRSSWMTLPRRFIFCEGPDPSEGGLLGVRRR